jgi:8-oxo-dGTP pyrophosphatase MutT (NUDIX family)
VTNVTTDLRPAATVLVLRDSTAGPEIFMVRRHDKAAFMGGAHVFPGGAVDAADCNAADPRWCDGIEYASAQIGNVAPAEALAFHVAAVRELFEEAGVLLAREESGNFVQLERESTHARFKQYRQDIHAGSHTLRDILQRERLRLAADALRVCAHWVTPPVNNSRRFDTRFFAARLPAGQQPAHDEHETTESLWTTASGAIAAAERREIVLPPPTWIMLRELESFRSVDDVLASMHGRTVERREPESVEENGHRVFIMPGPFASGTGPARRLTRFVWSEGRWLPQSTE